MWCGNDQSVSGQIKEIILETVNRAMLIQELGFFVQDVPGTGRADPL